VLLAIGLAAGVLLALVAARSASTLLFGITPSDPLTLLTAVTALAAIALVATYAPTRRATAIEPVAALRNE